MIPEWQRQALEESRRLSLIEQSIASAEGRPLMATSYRIEVAITRIKIESDPQPHPVSKEAWEALGVGATKIEAYGNACASGELANILGIIADPDAE